VLVCASVGFTLIHTRMYGRCVQGQDVVEKINKANVLIVGAGGIGCELLKNLVLSGFHRLEVRSSPCRCVRLVLS